MLDDDVHLNSATLPCFRAKLFEPALRESAIVFGVKRVVGAGHD